jgi:serine/threonine protein kinase
LFLVIIFIVIEFYQLQSGNRRRLSAPSFTEPPNDADMPVSAQPVPRLESAKRLSCKVLHEEKRQIYELSNTYGTIEKNFADFEKFYEKIQHLLPPNVDRPPKKKLLLAEHKLTEKRKKWVEAFSNYMIAAHHENYDVRGFFWQILYDPDENTMDLGPKENKAMKPTNFDYLKTIGQGSFGRVFMVRHRGDGRIYAMKVLGKEHIKQRNEVKHVMAERNVLKSNIDHPFLVSLHYSFQTKDKLYFVLDFLNGGELFYHLQRERNFAEPRAKFYAAEIASALGYLHEKSIIYRDLKPENLLLDKFGHVIITDFGLCKEGMDFSKTTNTFCGTPEYLAPEVILKKPYNHSVDWWCLGSVLYEMLFGLPPFYSKNQHEMYERALHQPLSIPSSASPLAKEILGPLLNKNPAERLGSKRDFEEIRDHAFFASIDWTKLLRREIKAPFVPKVKSDADTSNISREFVEIEPNQASLAPNATFIPNTDADFCGFTYVQKPNLMRA